jgi:hypothetical protein
MRVLGLNMAVMFQVEVWVVTPCSVMVGYRRYRDPYCFCVQVQVSMDL